MEPKISLLCSQEDIIKVNYRDTRCERIECILLEQLWQFFDEKISIISLYHGVGHLL